MENIQILGTSHIAQESIQEIRETIEEEQPDFIAVELDLQRLKSLKNKSKKSKTKWSNIFKVGIFGFLFLLIGNYIQKKLGKIVNTQPGADMLEAVKIAEEKKTPLILIDRDIQITLKRFSKEFGIKEIFKIIKDIIKGIITRENKLEKYNIKKINLNKVPDEETIQKMTQALKQEYPSIHKVLIEERNQYMAERLKELKIQNPESKILAVVGAGHKKGIKQILSKTQWDYTTSNTN